jgi:myosin heavy subunit
MAKNADTEFSKSKSFQEMNEALKLAFRNIKNDMTTLREGLHQQGINLAAIGQDMKEGKADFVTVDKFNILKIKIGELNENMKKLWEVEKKLEDLDRKTVSATDFDKQTATLQNEIAKLKQDVTGLDKVTATEEQVKSLATDVNEEFDKIKKGIEELRSLKDTLTRAELDKRTDALNKKADDLRKDFIKVSDKVTDELRDKISVKQVEAFVKDVNSEFDGLKKVIADIKAGEKRFALASNVDDKLDRIEHKVAEATKNLSAVVDEFSKGIEDAFGDFLKANEKRHDTLAKQLAKSEESLADEISKAEENASAQAAELKESMKDLVTRKQAENLVSDLNKEFDGMKDGIEQTAKELTLLKKTAATKDEMRDLFSDMREKVNETNFALKERYEDLLAKLKKETDLLGKGIKNNSQDLDEVEKAVGKELRLYVLREELETELESLHAEMGKMPTATDIDKELRKRIKASEETMVDKRQFNKLVDVVAMLQERVELQRELVKEKKKELKSYSKQLRKAKKAEKKLAKYEAEFERVSVKEQAMKTKNGKKDAKKQAKDGSYKKSSFIANFLIVAAFVILIAAIAFFFSGLSGLTDTLAIAAVVCFVLGIIIRIVVSFKSSE